MRCVTCPVDIYMLFIQIRTTTPPPRLPTKPFFPLLGKLSSSFYVYTLDIICTRTSSATAVIPLHPPQSYSIRVPPTRRFTTSALYLRRYIYCLRYYCKLWPYLFFAVRRCTVLPRTRYVTFTQGLVLGISWHRITKFRKHPINVVLRTRYRTEKICEDLKRGGYKNSPAGLLTSEFVMVIIWSSR